MQALRVHLRLVLSPFCSTHSIYTKGGNLSKVSISPHLMIIHPKRNASTPVAKANINCPFLHGFGHHTPCIHPLVCMSVNQYAIDINRRTTVNIQSNERPGQYAILQHVWICNCFIVKMSAAVLLILWAGLEQISVAINNTSQNIYILCSTTVIKLILRLNTLSCDSHLLVCSDVIFMKDW